MIAGFFRRKLVDVLLAQLRQGVTPARLALSCALGAALGVFPILGSTTVLCLAAAYFLRLNQPTIQAVNYFAYPLQLLLLPVFVRLGEWIFRADPVPFSPQTLVREFAAGPGPFLERYGAAGLYGIAAWALLAPLAAGLVYGVLVRVFRWAASLHGGKTNH